MSDEFELLDAADINNIHTYLGASETPSCAILGGYAADYSIGGNALYKIRSNILDWKLLPNNASEKRRIQTINNILNLGVVVDGPVLCGVIKELFIMPDKELSQVLIKNLGLKEPLEIALRKLYYVWLDMIEFLLAFLLKQEGVRDTDQLIAADLKKIKFDTSKKDLSAFLKKAYKYEHTGYCPCEPVKRIVNLFTFPLGDLIKLLQGRDATFSKIDIDDIYNRIIDIIKQVDVNRDVMPVFKRPAISNKCDLDMYTTKFLELYRTSYKYLVQQEMVYIELAKKIVEICSVIEKVLSKF